VRDEGLVGTLFLPSSPPPYPVVITLGGSLPGVFTAAGMPFASQGIATLALAYFGMESLPPELKRIPLEYFGTAIQWCRRHEQLMPDEIGVAGVSRGGELALLVASTFFEIVGVVGWAPSVYGGLGRSTNDELPAWSRAGQDLPFARFERAAVNWNKRPIRLTPGFIAGLSGDATATAAEIHVECINGPILLISGTDDQVWPSTMLADIAVRRLRRLCHPFSVEHLCYEGAGHAIGPPHPYGDLGTTHVVHPVLGDDFELGGTSELNAKASRDSWERIVKFFKERGVVPRAVEIPVK
jgi:dienelactone hydrolase